MDGVWIGETFEPDAIGLARGRLGALRAGKAAQNNAKRNHRAAHRKLHPKGGALLRR
jgi:hypothetical protein